MANWQDCIVSLIDLIGIKNIILNQNGKGSALMRQLHKIVAVEMNLGLQHHAHAYVWNDSVLLLAYLDGNNLPEIILREVDELKRKLDGLGNSYAISVKGQAFPPLGPSCDSDSQQRTTVVKASSYALANCFRIEAELGKKLKKSWYVDGRIAKYIRGMKPCEKHKVKLLPHLRSRMVYVYDGVLWQEGDHIN